MKGQKRVERLRPRLKELYAVHKQLERLGAPPSIREVINALGLDENYVSRVHGDLETLEKLGLVERLPIPTRRFRCIGPPPDEINWEELLDP